MTQAEQSRQVVGPSILEEEEVGIQIHDVAKQVIKRRKNEE